MYKSKLIKYAACATMYVFTRIVSHREIVDDMVGMMIMMTITKLHCFALGFLPILHIISRISSSAQPRAFKGDFGMLPKRHKRKLVFYPLYCLVFI